MLFCFPPETGSKSFERCIFTKIKTCIGHCLIFLHHSPPEGNLGMNIETKLKLKCPKLCWYFAYDRSDDDLHFRFAFPWYSYSPTLKFRQLDMSSDEEKDKKGQNLPLSSTAKQGESSGWKRLLEGSQRELVASLTALQSTAGCGLQIPLTASPDYSLSQIYHTVSCTSCWIFKKQMFPYSLF